MVTQLIINVPVYDPRKSKTFFEEIGFLFNQELTDENAICFNINEKTILALLQIDHFKDAINNNQVADVNKTKEMLLSLGVESKTEVDTLMNKAIKAGGREIGPPTDYGSIYGATFADPDGHSWNIYHMDSNLLL